MGSPDTTTTTTTGEERFPGPAVVLSAMVVWVAGLLMELPCVVRALSPPAGCLGRLAATGTLLAGLGVLQTAAVLLLLLLLRWSLGDRHEPGTRRPGRAGPGPPAPGGPPEEGLSLEHRARGSLVRLSRARMLAAGPCLTALGYCLLQLSHWMLESVHDHELGAAAWVFAALFLTLAAVVATFALGRLLGRLLPDTVLRVGVVLPVAVLFPAAGGLALLASPWVGLSRIPWQPALAGLLLVALVLANRSFLPRWGVVRRAETALRGPRTWLLVLGGLALLGICEVLAGSCPEALRLVSDRSLLARHTLAAAYRLSDVDGDGYGSLLGGGDCAAFDPIIHPGAVDLPGNGIDENCNGADSRPEVTGPPAYLEDHPLLSGGPWSFMLIVLDAVRADHVSFLGYHRPTTPHLDELARRSLVFSRAYSPAATTRFSIPALLAGRHPSSLAWRRKGRNLFLRPHANLMIQERLKRAGFFTAAVTCSFDIFIPGFGLARGFSRYDNKSVRYPSRRTIRGRRSPQVTDAILRLVEESGTRPFFIYAHYMDPHAPYDDPDGPTFGAEDVDRYDAEILFTDGEVGRLLDELGPLLRGRRVVVAVTADHGDQFKERGRTGHGRFVYDEEVHVPLLLHIPSLAPRRIDAAVSLIDLAPTFANLAQVKQGWELFEGRNLLEVLEEGSSERPMVVETWPFAAFSERRVALVEPPHKLIFSFRGQSWELYDLLQDPGEKKDLYSRAKPGVRAALQNRLQAWLEAHVPRASP